MNYQIPEKEVENILSAYWQLLSEVECKTNPVKDPSNKVLVEGAYNILNRAGISKERPRWEKTSAQ